MCIRDSDHDEGQDLQQRLFPCFLTGCHGPLPYSNVEEFFPPLAGKPELIACDVCDAVEDIIGVGIAGLINRVGGDYGGYSAGGWIDAVDIVIHPDIGVDGIAHALEFIDVFEGLSL